MYLAREEAADLNLCKVKEMESYCGTSSLVKSGGTDALTNDAIGFLWMARNISNISLDRVISSCRLQLILCKMKAVKM